MLRKLMKYEFMAMGRLFLPVSAALLILSLVNRLLSYLPIDAPQVIGIVISVILMVGIVVLTFILTLQRFRNNLMSNEGHLMMTLPVSTDKLILSKMFVAAICGAASVIVVMLSIMIMAVTSFNFTWLRDLIRMLGNALNLQPAYAAIFAVEFVLAIILGVFAGILLLYTCMSLSMLVNKRRGLFTFGAFVVITTAMQILSVVIVAVLGALKLGDLFSINELSTFSQIQLAVLMWFILEIVCCAAYYLITRYMLKNRLNLQ